MSGQGRNVGTLRGPRLWWKLLFCFQSLCKMSEGHFSCNDKKDLQVCRIQNVVSDKYGEDWDATSSITVSYRLVKHSIGHDLDYPTVHENSCRLLESYRDAY